MEQEITEAVHALKEAIDNVRYQADKSILATVLAKAEAISNELDQYDERARRNSSLHERKPKRSMKIHRQHRKKSITLARP